MTHHVMASRSGRAIGISGLGDPASQRLVLWCHPSPGASGFDPDPRVTEESGLRIMSLDRPGYGATDPAPNGSVDAWLDDVAELLEIVRSTADSVSHTEFGPLGVIGWGVGGVYAAALAARHPELVDRLVLIGSPTPESSQGPDPVLLGHSDGSARHPGFGDRLERMLEDASAGDGGRELDRTVVASTGHRDLDKITALTLLIHPESREGHRDARWWRRRIPGSRVRAVASSSTHLVADAWPDALLHVRAH